MLVGSYGDITFMARRGMVCTFDDYSRGSSARWAKHDVMGKKPVMEFIGPDIEKITFTMQFRTANGIVPEVMLDKLRKLRDQGKPQLLVLAGRPVGKNYWVIESLGEAVKFWGKYGNIESVEIDVSLTEYVKRRVSL